MLSPKARKALALIATLLAAAILSIASLTYLLFFSPNARALRSERAADNHFYVAKENISVLSLIAENENRSASLKKAAEHQQSEGQIALKEAKEAKSDYKNLLNATGISNSTRKRITNKIRASEHLIKAADNYIEWLKEAENGVETIKYTYQSFDMQSKGLKQLNKAISEINAGNNKKALEISKEISNDFRSAQKAILKARNNFSNADMAELNRMVNLYIESSKSLQKMAKATKNDTDTYNREVDKLNKATAQASKIAAKSPLAKDLNLWLEKNFYYQGGELIFHYKKAIEVWPNE